MPTLIVSAARAELAPRMARQRIDQRSACMRLFDMWDLLGSGRTEHDVRCNGGTIRRTSRGPGELHSGKPLWSGGRGRAEASSEATTMCESQGRSTVSSERVV